MVRMPLKDEWPRLEPLVDAVLDVAPEQRAALIAELSRGDLALQEDLERLVAECEQAYPLLDRPASERFAGLFDEGTVAFPQSLATRYRDAKELGHGGMAVVFLAHDVKHGRDVAVKVVRPELAEALGRERFLREIEIVAGLRHPHIVPLYDSGESDGSLYYVMPFEEGYSLRQRLDRDGQLSVQATTVILRDVCDAIAYAHGRGIVHRDIKPENVLISGEHAMVADFGIARAVHRPITDSAMLTAGAIIGTPAYMPPEQISSDPSIDHRADIYSIGVLAYEMLAGRRPFSGDTPQDLLAAHLTEPPAPLATHRSDVPPALDALIAKCLEKRPQDRWQSTGEVLERLQAFTADRPSAFAARPNSPRRLARRIMLGVATLGVAVWAYFGLRDAAWQNPLANARLERLTDFPGSEVDAAISSDGKFVAFLADSAGQFDAFVTQIGSGRFVNLSNGRLPELYNEDVRNVGFSGDATQVWLRTAGIAATPSVSLVPTMGGPLKPFLDRAVMAEWAPDGKRVAYHEGGDDPIFIADQNGQNPRQVFKTNRGKHSHYLTWSPDARYLYFAHGVPPDDMDIWRVAVDSGVPERLTMHNASVAYPVMLDNRTLIYVTTAADGTGPWLYSMNVDERVPRRVSTGVEHTLSVSAAADVRGQPRRLVTTVSNPSVSLWSAPLANDIVDEQQVTRVENVPTARARGPRFAADGTLFYLASRSGADGLWRLRDGVATELTTASDGAVVGAASVAPDGRTICAPVRRQDRTRLYCTSGDGTNGRIIAESLDVRGAGSWSPDGKWIAIAAQDSAGVRLYKIPANGGAPVNLVQTVSSNPVWSPDGTYILYSGAPRARVVPVLAVTPEGGSHPLPPLTVDRIGDSYRFLPGGTRLVVKQGGFRRQDFFSFDLASGQQRPLTKLRHGESLLRFDVSPDGKRIVFERVRENSDIVMIELAR
jgi:serine/threonine protein kinase/Tol biopolymer transport system component